MNEIQATDLNFIECLICHGKGWIEPTYPDECQFSEFVMCSSCLGQGGMFIENDYDKPINYSRGGY